MTTFDFKTLQSEVGEWARRNFPNATAEDPWLGVMEEFGELCHAQLKLKQGIRGDREQLEAERVDAVGDMIVFLSHYCELRGIEMRADQMHDSSNEYNAACSIGARIGNIASNELCGVTENREQWVAWLVGAIVSYCEACNINFENAVNTTWSKVKQRDWLKNRKDGVNA